MTMRLRQPALGMAGTIVAVGLALLVVGRIDSITMAGWVTLFASAAIPLQFVVAVVWHHRWPPPIAALPQPAQGVAFTLIFAAFGAVMAAAMLFALGGGITPPNPAPVTFAIYSVQITILFVIAFGGWPASLVPSPGWRTAATLGIAYMLSFALFRALFNFAHLRGAPFYVAGLDPHGLFVAWGPITLTMATVAALLTLVYFDMAPITVLARRYPAIGRQPLFGMLVLSLSVLLGTAFWLVGVASLGGDLVVFLARADVAYVFGTLMVINLFAMGRFVTLPQPLRGTVLTVATILLAVVVVPLFTAVAAASFGRLAAGPPGYDLELWVASALLAVTFPMMTLYSGAFAFWPFGADESQR